MSLSIHRLAMSFAFVTISAIHAAEPQPAVNPEAQVLADFSARVKAYVDLVKKADAGVPPLKETTNPADIVIAQDALAERIRAARAGAKQGDIFTPDVQKKFRTLLRPELQGKKGVETKKAIAEDGPMAVPLKINVKYPEKEPLSTVPPNVLLSLPKLPEELEYRFVGKYLILRDARANIIVDFIPNAIP
jgi:hypothetical protein